MTHPESITLSSKHTFELTRTVPKFGRATAAIHAPYHGTSAANVIPKSKHSFQKHK